jgi:UDP-2-acetamido-2-deoxy-ribo-hexuluronate aminotransferase
MQFIDLKTQQAAIRPELDRRIAAVLDHGQYILGPEVVELERLLAEYVGTKHCLSMASGTDALLVA